MHFHAAFTWTDGSSLNYANWADNEPNNVNGEEHCGELVLDSREWNDNICYISKHYVCKLPRGINSSMHYGNMPMQYTEIFKVVKNKKKISENFWVFFLFLLKT